MLDGQRSIWLSADCKDWKKAETTRQLWNYRDSMHAACTQPQRLALNVQPRIKRSRYLRLSDDCTEQCIVARSMANKRAKSNTQNSEYRVRSAT